ncbi:putative membrane protein [Methanococcoides vulcani]|uniref:Putative membrane protein n=1 Tax=Methanococcoides vulcani TaxID=1353158 RepID=A0A1H9YM40_9EURY|nr:tripartite tricarboxylate transporter permease [Methanococcoides vulcani]SES70141.1 putative membrane protein [Methanococcoides vulcani]
MPSDITIPMLLLSVLIGYALGIFSGLIPGIHTNNFALMLVALSPMLMDSGIPPTYIAIAILANSLSHTFHDIIPAVYLGAPNDDMALAVLPGHRLLLEGFGSEAIRLSALGSAGSVAFSLIIAVPLAFAFSNIYPILQNYLGLLLLLISVSLILSEKGEYIINQGSLVKYKYKAYALILFVLTGFLGLFAFRMETSMHPLIDFGSPSILLPLLSGLFGASQLLISLFSGSHIPPQKYSKIELPAKRIIRGVITGSAAGSIVAWLPGISSSIAAVLARLFIKSDFDRKGSTKNREEDKQDYGCGSECEYDNENGNYYRYEDDEFYIDETMESSKEFIVSVSGVNTANAIFGLFALAVIGKTRSGAMVAVDELLEAASLTAQDIILFLLVIAITALLSYLSTIAIGNNIHRMLAKLDYSMICITVLLGLALMSLLFTGFFGLLIFVIAIPLGMSASFMKIRKSHAMGVILLPVILYFL